jgi:hypothetical protein
MKLPNLVPVLQNFPHRGLPDVAASVRNSLAGSGLGKGLPSGSRIAVGVGSRGVANLSTIVRSAVGYLREIGMQPFVIPAMGSHGGGTAEGQTEVLAHYGVTEQGVGCPIRSSLDVISMGQTPEGIETWLDRTAAESDGVLLINRVKWHTTFEAPVESGLVKMAAVGLGKLQGAANYHRHAVRLGLGHVVRSAGHHMLSSGKILGGLAILEDAHHDTAEVVALPAARIEAEEQRLLEKVRASMPRILFREVDILIVEETGKHISGTGMDSKVINRHPYGAPNPWPWAPRILRVYVRDLSPLSYGNAIGIGMADAIPERLFGKIDWHATKVNATTSSNLASIRTPLRVANDSEGLELLGRTVGRANPSEVTCVWIRNTLELGRILATENLIAEVKGRDDMEIAGPASEWNFDEDGNLTGFDRMSVPAAC